MKKTKTSMTFITRNFSKVFQTGYCELFRIFYTMEPQYYNAGVYGWNCDIYVNYSRDIAISTGYRNMRGKTIPFDLIQKYSAIADDILKNRSGKSYDEIRELLDYNAMNFLNELAAL